MNCMINFYSDWEILVKLGCSLVSEDPCQSIEEISVPVALVIRHGGR